MSDHCSTHEVPGASDCHCGSSSAKTLVAGSRRIALAGAPNAGKTSIYNALTGLHAKTGNYPGVTVTRSLGTCKIGDTTLTIEDLPGAYSLDPISPDEQVVRDVLTDASETVSVPDALVVVIDATTLRRGMNFVAEALALDLPTCLVVTMTDELTRRSGRLDVAALGQALGIPAVRVVGNRGIGLPELRERLTEVVDWQRPPLAPPTTPGEVASWADSILAAADYEAPQQDRVTTVVDRVLLHPVLGSLVFFAIMYAFFQAIFTWAAPFQDAVEGGFSALGALVHSWLDDSHPLLAGLLGDGIIGGVGSVLTFIPHDHHHVPHHRLSRRRGVHVASGLPHGQDHEPGRAGGAGLRGTPVLLRLRDPRDHGHPHASQRQGPGGHDAGRPAHDLLSAPARLRPAHLHHGSRRREDRAPGSARHRHVRALPAGSRLRDDGRLGGQAPHRPRRGAPALLHGDAALPAAAATRRRAHGVGRLQGLREEGRHDHHPDHHHPVGAAQRPHALRGAVQCLLRLQRRVRIRGSSRGEPVVVHRQG
ncbi:ferrous iron transport protein B [Actinomyces naeslundii str. Howell 279]|uniref:Ferrous iron transport protein B n=1 Tax=Actinomyces naeslundii (strain ATCC 12104 / DSM 43013 / CCUG 2238 / JCM 8349 / NCTC 10301 / Howell 279) TaxID=1115803 RepID=J3F1C1_ACTNH|nr:ferrous iron transport protein B [Actinomyces naeslundii str. Howell 279]